MGRRSLKGLEGQLEARTASRLELTLTGMRYVLFLSPPLCFPLAIISKPCLKTQRHIASPYMLFFLLLLFFNIPATTPFNFQNLPNFFPNNANNALLSTAKSDLLTFVSTLNRGASASPADRLRVESLVDSLLSSAPPPLAFAESPKLYANWRLEYTTEAELLGLMKNPDTIVTQSIGPDYLRNFVGFAGGFCDEWEFTGEARCSRFPNGSRCFY